LIATSHLFRPLGRELVTLLQGLTPEEWTGPTSAPEWSVKDVAAHLLDVDLRRLSAQRDGHIPAPTQPIASNADLVAYLNHLNRTWVEAARRLSAQVLVEELRLSSDRVAALFETSDPMAPATFPVAWAGEESSRAWFDIAREYTERWHHQDQIRDAVGAPPLADSRWLRPVLETSLLALPHAFRDVAAPEGACVVIRVVGDSGGEWTLRRQASWRIESGSAPAPISTLSASDLVVCRLLLQRLPADEAARSVQAEGRVEFLAPLLNARAVMV
jgi:uncharacterized protein (TIGR03083 family)